jgi:hypothetical protein
MPDSDASAGPPAPPRPRRPDRDLVVSVAAIAVSLCALGVSLAQTAVMRAQQHAAVWPRLTTGLDADSASLTLSVRNAGVGPAQVVWAQLTLDGRPLDGWPALLDRAPAAAPGGPRERLSGTARYVSVTGDVLVPGERKVALALTGPVARAVFAATARVGLRACYCSVFDRCWRLDSPGLGVRLGSERATPVRTCERPAGPIL